MGLALSRSRDLDSGVNGERLFRRLRTSRVHLCPCDNARSISSRRYTPHY